MKKILFAAHLCIFAALYSTHSIAIPIDAASRAAVAASLFNLKSFFFADESRENPVATLETILGPPLINGFPLNAAAASADLRTGVMRNETRAIQALNSSFSELIEFITFDISTTVSYEMAIDGTMRAASAGDVTFFDSSIRMFDVTNVDMAFQDNQFANFDRLSFDVLLNELEGGTRTGAQHRGESANPILSQEGADLFGYDIFIDEISDEITPLMVDVTATGSFNVIGGNTYVLSLENRTISRSVSNTVTYADFYNTSSFSFTDLGGANFQSLSGVFLSAVDVPEPDTIILFGIGVASMALIRRRRKSTISS